MEAARTPVVSDTVEMRSLPPDPATRSVWTIQLRRSGGSLKRRTLVISLVVSTALFGACSTDATESRDFQTTPDQTELSDNPQSPSSPPTSDNSVAASVLESQSPSHYPVGQEWRELVPLGSEMDQMFALAYRVWQEGTQRCMQDRGYSFTPRRYIDEKRIEFYRALNPLNEEVAKSFGYHAPPQPQVIDENTDTSSGYLEALGGTETDSSTGCASIAMKEAYVDVDPVINDYQLLVDELDRSVYAYLTSSEGLEAERRWSACMTDVGYSFSSRDDAASQFLASQTVTDAEIRVRLADLECDRTTNYTESRSSWEAAEVDRWLERTSLQWPPLGDRIAAVVTSLEALVASA